MSNNNNINIHLPPNLEVDSLDFKKMAFVYNAVESGWEVKKKDTSYVFKKRHEDKKEVFSDDYLRNFIEENMLLFPKK